MKGYLVTLSFLVILLSGCADVYIARPTLQYTTIIPRSPSTDIAIYVSDFDDIRPNKGSGYIGTVSLGPTHYDGIVEPPNIAPWVTDAFKDELLNAGFRLSQRADSLNLKGEILSLSASNKVGAFDAAVVLRMRITRDNAVLLDKTYDGKAHKFVLAAVSLRPDCEEVLKESLQQVIRQAIGDIAKTLKENKK